MLAAIIPQGKRAWFFKVTGPSEAVRDKAEAFEALIKSVRFSGADDSTPEWTLPEGWQQEPGTGMRYATLQMASTGEPLELSVTVLPWDQENEATSMLKNINRWRGQLQLPPIDTEQLAEQTSQLQLKGATATLVSLADSAATSGIRRPPVASGQPAAPHGVATAPISLTYDVPQGWTQGRVGGMRKAAFNVTDGEQSVEITVIDLKSSAGELLPNVNLWRGQIQLGETTQEELDRQIKKIKVGPATGHTIELVGPEGTEPRQAILGVVLIDADRAWFFKLKGNAELAEREKERFEAFVQSVRFTAAEGAGDGK
jgi:hypothetical protein